MSDRTGIFAGDDPFDIARNWLAEAETTEPNDANAIALATVDDAGRPNVRMVLLKEIEDAAFVFYTNYDSKKGHELDATPEAAFVIHWKTLRRQIRVRGSVSREDGPQADEYFNSRSLKSRIGAIASQQSQPLESRAALMAAAAKIGVQQGVHPKRPANWGGFRIVPYEMEFWADGEFRLHDRFRWTRNTEADTWATQRLFP
ncbi:MAG: pyridoxamine 5'-phosphate oxidase [Pseudomonadota bacterium]